MEEDIKRINCLIERCKQCKLNECITCDICWSEVQAIENLINRNKELEEKNTKLQEKNEELKEENEHYNDLMYTLETYYDITEEDLENSVKEGS